MHIFAGGSEEKCNVVVVLQWDLFFLKKKRVSGVVNRSVGAEYNYPLCGV